MSSNIQSAKRPYSDSKYLSNDQKVEDQGPDYVHNIKELQARTRHLKNLKNVKLKATRKLYIIAAMCVVFMIIEFVGGIISHSLAIMTDAAHILSDFCGFMISIVSIFISFKPANQSMTYGYHRAEIIGALGSVLLIWGLAAWLLTEAVKRVLYPEKIDPLIMLITACIGLVINITMAKILHGRVDGHSHGHSHGHHHHHHHHDQSPQHDEEIQGSDQQQDPYGVGDNFIIPMNQFIKQEQQDIQDNCQAQQKKQPLLGNNKNYIKIDNELAQDQNPENIQIPIFQKTPQSTQKKKTTTNAVKANLNVRAAFIHILGDIIQSIGVVIAAIIIMIDNDLVIADPITTFLCSILVVLTTLPIFKQSIFILMEGTPEQINILQLYQDILNVTYSHCTCFSTLKFRQSKFNRCMMFISGRSPKEKWR